MIPTPQDQPTPPDAGHETDALIADAAKTDALAPAITAALKKVYDPEIPVDIVELGLIYDVFVTADGTVAIRMTLTAPACPAAGEIIHDVQQKVEGVEGVVDCPVQLTFDPPWTKDMMSEEAKLELGFL